MLVGSLVVKTLGDTINFTTILTNTGTDPLNVTLEHGFEGFETETRVLTLEAGADLNVPTTFTASVVGVFDGFARVFEAGVAPPQLLAELTKPGILEVIDTTPESASLSFTSNPTGADIQVIPPFGDVLIGITPVSFNNLDPGTYTWQVSKAGFIQQVGTINLIAGSDETINVNLESIGFTVSGQVTDSSTGIGIFGANLNFIGLVIKGTQTNFVGNYSISGLLIGNYNIQLSHPDYEDKNVPVFIGSDKTFNITMTPKINIGSVSGQVTDGSTGDPIIGVNITWSGPSSGNTQTSTNGLYNIGNLPVGNYDFTFTHPEYQTRSFPREIFANFSLVLDVSLTRIAPPDTGDLGGQVTNALTGSPLQGVRIDIEGPASVTTQTNFNGVYFVSTLSAGGYTVTFSKPGFITIGLSTQVFAGTTNILDISLFPT